MRTMTVVGCGPRGIAVLERLITLLNEQPPKAPLHIIVAEDKRMGQGRIWDSTQSAIYLTNTPALSMSIFSGYGPLDAPRPGAGPSLADWWRETHDDFEHYHGFAPRRYYGEYLNFAYQAICRHLPAQVTLEEKAVRVTDVQRDGEAYRVETEQGDTWHSHQVIFATGHSTNAYHGYFKRLEQFAHNVAPVQFLHGDSAHDMPFDTLKAGESVGIIGLGSAFYDVMSALTEGRGGRFEASEDGLVYRPSGQEPRMWCGSRKGLPTLALAEDNLPEGTAYPTDICSVERLQQLREAQGGNVDFARDVWPLVEAEVNLLWCGKTLGAALGDDAEAQFRAYVLAEGLEDSAAIAAAASRRLQRPLLPLNLDDVAHPFVGRAFDHADEWEAAVMSLLRTDTREAALGNVDSPYKAALDVLKVIRGNLGTVVHQGGLSPDAHQAFVEHYAPIIIQLSAAPPVLRLRQLIALIEAGVVSIVPPGMCVTPVDDHYRITAEAIPDYQQCVTALIDARIPVPSVQEDLSPLMRHLVERGTFVPFVNRDAAGHAYETGSVAMDDVHHPIDAQGEVQHDLFVAGVPTEHLRWPTQIGCSRPTSWTAFMQEADVVARGALAR